MNNELEEDVEGSRGPVRDSVGSWLEGPGKKHEGRQAIECSGPGANRAAASWSLETQRFDRSCSVHLLQLPVFVDGRSRLTGSVMRVSFNNEPTCSA